MEKLIKDIRVEIDGYAQLARSIRFHSREIYLSKAWLGEILGKLGTASPYIADDKRHTIEDIKPAADVAEKFEFPLWKETDVKNINNVSSEIREMNQIEKFSYLRLKLKETKKKIANLIQVQGHYNNEIAKNFISATQNPTSLEDELLVQELKKNPLKNIDITLEVNNAYMYITNYIFDLGFELQRIKELADQEK